MSFLGLFPATVKKMAAKGDVPGLIKVLTHEKKIEMRAEAAEALGQLGDARAVEPLLAALKDEQAKEAWKVQRPAAVALGQLGDARAIEPLVAALEDWSLRAQAALALEKLGWQPGRDESGARFWIGRGRQDQCIELGALAVEPLIADLKVPRAISMHKFAAEVLGKVGDERAIEPLIDALNGIWNVSDEGALNSEVNALIGFGKRAVEPVLKGLTAKMREFEYVNPEMGHILGVIGDAESVPALLALFRKFQRPYLAYALQKLGGTDVQSEVSDYYRNLVFVIEFADRSYVSPPDRDQQLRSFYARAFPGRNIELLGSESVVDVPVPTQKNDYVIASCIKICKQAWLPFDPRRDEIGYYPITSVGQVHHQSRSGIDLPFDTTRNYGVQSAIAGIILHLP